MSETSVVDNSHAKVEYECDPNCLFCKITRHQEPASRVHEDDICMVFMDLFPISKGHVLIVPKQHAVLVHELDDSVRRHLYDLANRVMKAVRKTTDINCTAANIMINDGKDANQHIPHVHLHIIPRFKRDELKTIGRFVIRMHPFGMTKRRQRLDALAKAIKEKLEL